MSSFDDLFRQENEQPTPRNDQPFDKEVWAQKKQEQREQVYTMIDETAVAVSQDGLKFQAIWMCRVVLTVTVFPMPF